jgi:hypothetical protein
MDRTRVMTAAVAVAIVTNQHLPSSEVDNAEVYFNTQLMPLVQRLVSAFNEKVVFDVRACIEQVRQLWHLRYSAAFGNILTMPEEGGNFFNKFTGVERYISCDFYDFANAHSRAIVSLSFFAAMIIDELSRGV